MGRNKGGARWTFGNNGVLQLLINLHFTGSRAFIIDYTLVDGTQKSVNISTMQKGTYCNWNVLENAGVSDGTQLRSLTLRNNNSKGEARIYDMYVRVPDRSTSTGLNTDDASIAGPINKATDSP